MSLPAAAKTFLSQVPAAWDETRGLSGEPGKAVIVARRNGDAWYVGGLNADTAQDVSVPLAFLGQGTWQLTLIRDGAGDRSFETESRAVQASDAINVAMRTRGGFVMRIERAKAPAF